MAESTLLVAGLALSFASADASQLQLSVTLTASTSATLVWQGQTQTSSSTTHHVFRSLAAPIEAPIDYELTAGGVRVARTVLPLAADRLRLAVIGPGGMDAGPHHAVNAQLGDMDAIVRLGAVVRKDGERPVHRSMPSFGTAAQPTGRRVHRPTLHIGDGTVVWDDIREALGLPRHVFHLRLGPLLLVALDPTVEGDAHAQFVQSVLSRHAAAPWRVALLAGDAHTSFAVDGPWDAVVSVGPGYQRSVERGIARIQTQGPTSVIDRLPPRRPGSIARTGAPHWVRLSMTQKTAAMAALGLEGAVIDAAPLDRPSAKVPDSPRGQDASSSQVHLYMLGAAGVLFAGLITVVVGLLRGGRGPR